ncbi:MULTISPECIES: NUDIX domain-containing protein [Alphaproteobacteria]|uniref:GDP-mannose pyrophosphatase n=2 Tax=Alphaproteobacteria TaxID=28211 RepID=A0A512HGJ3_9HYPH|nr:MULTISPECIES: NUDIX hydrolase [Alphaproteobacteria]GEO84575.1 ADP-ribose pyrophosphatase [Ciceribacter naphthalenivorans]GLR22538.1 ADP-ribose pyrophosphatase [Ciceribacter naphthalenivorans]GLT05394.1 ADP-ribose pyrophosphatase [Sphingomonas psychrolutea]
MSRFDKVRIAILKDETLWKGWSHFRRIVFDYIRPDDSKVKLTWEVFDRGEAVAILLYDPQRRVVVMVRQFRIPVYLMGSHPFLLEVPAGSMEQGEDAAETVCREAMEETGYRVDQPRHLFSAYTSPGAVTEKVHFYFAQINAEQKVADGGGLAEEHEDIEIVEVSLDAALAMVGDGRICDAKTIMLLQWAALNPAALSA